MKFLSKLTLNIDKLPKYTAFTGDFVIDIDYKGKQILRKCMDSENPIFKKEIKNRIETLLSLVEKHPLRDKLIVKHSQRLNIGRFYPNNNDALITLSRHVKHTLFNYMNWIDIDMVKGHPSILYSLFRKFGYELEAFKTYIENTDYIFKELLEHYSVNNNLTKDNIKKVFNIAIYGGSYNTWLTEMDEKQIELKTDEIHPFIKNFIADCKEASNLIFKANPDIKARLEKCKNKYDNNDWELKNAVMSYFCQAIENEILHIAYKFLVKHNIITPRKNVEIEYDGFCFKMPENIEISDIENIILLLNDKIEKDTGFSVKFKIKPYDNSHIHFDIIEQVVNSNENQLDTGNPNSFENCSIEFEKSHCKIINKSVFIKESSDEIIVLSRQQLKTSYEHLVIETIKDNEIIKSCFIDSWLSCNPNQRCYDDVGVYPNDIECPKNIFNLWRPFEMELVEKYEKKEEELKIILNHIKILCNNDDNVYCYFIKWIAQMIQYPAVKSICPTLISLEGAGKGSFLKLLGKMLGDKKVFETTTPSRDVWGDFNGRMCNTFLINLNELSKKEMTECEGRFKGLVTDTKLTINNKGVNQYVIQSYHRFIITTNKEEPINTSKDDRRNLIIRSSDELLGNKIYFEKLHEILDDVNVIKTCYEYFKTIPDVDKFNRLPIPITDYQTNLKQLSVSPIENWLEALTLENYDKEYVELLGCEASSMFKKWCSDNNIEYAIDSRKLGIRLTNLRINGILKGKHTYKGESKIYDINELKKHFNLDCKLVVKKSVSFTTEKDDVNDV